MSHDGAFDARFVEMTMDYMLRALPDNLKSQLETLSDPAATKQGRRTAREIILHLIGNVTVIAAAGLNHAIPEHRLGDYETIIRAFMQCRRALIKNSFEILPQIDEAYAILQNPQLDK